MCIELHALSIVGTLMCAKSYPQMVFSLRVLDFVCFFALVKEYRFRYIHT